MMPLSQTRILLSKEGATNKNKYLCLSKKYVEAQDIR